MHFKLSAYNDHIALLFSGYTCPYSSKVSQILKLGVNEFCLIVLNSYVKSRVCFRVLSRNSQMGKIIRLNLFNHFVGFILCQIYL